MEYRQGAADRVTRRGVLPVKKWSLIVVALAAAACAAPAGNPAAQSPAAVAPAPGPANASGADSGAVSGVVAETMNSGGYTYARLTANGADTWIAAAEFPIVIGATLTATVDMPMRNFRSRTLNREFTEISFVRDVVMNGTPVTATSAPAGAPAMAGSHGDADAEPAAPSLIARVPPAPGGITVGEVWAKRAALSGKPIVIRGQIVKVNYEIMGANWYHLQDGSGVVADGTHDLVVTSSARVKAGDVVTISGVLTTDKDFGAGYSYEAIVEKADIRP